MMYNNNYKILKIFLLVSNFIFLNLFCFSDEYHIYQQEIVKTIPVGSEDYEVNNNMLSPVDRGPSGLGFDLKGFLYICDMKNNKLVLFYNNFNYKKAIHNIYSAKAKQIEVKNGECYLKYSFEFSFAGDTFSGNRKFLIDLRYSEYRNNICWFPNFIYYADIVFIYLRDGSLISIPNPGLDYKKNNEKILNKEETKKLFKLNKNDALKGLKIDEKNRLFLNGKLLTHDYKVFIDYWHEKNNIKGNSKSKLDIKRDEWFYINQPLTYLGIDNNGNYYWNASKIILVFNKEGILIDIFLPNDTEKMKTIPAVHPSGDIYFLDYDGEKNYLYRVKNVWDPKGRAKWYRESGVKDIQPISQTAGNQSATVTADSLRVRKSSSLNASVIDSLKNGDSVEILQRGFSKVTINGITDYWYKIRRSSDGLEGWCFGGYLRLE